MLAIPARASEFQPDEVVEGRYHILRKLADGGMGTVFLAEHVLIKRRVAIKVLHAELAADLGMVRRFMNEASAAGTLGHPHIVESTDMGVTKLGLPYIVFEYLEGCLLTEEIYRVGGLPVRRALQIAAQVASALDAAHDAKIVHLDLKSDNVFLSDKGESLDHAKVLDFGISRFMEADLEKTQRGLVIGTPEFMAPEQIMTPDLVDARADVHALGVLLYEMLTARRPYTHDDARVLLHRIVHVPPPALERAVPPALERLLFDRLLAKAPEARLQTMRDVKLALEEIAGTLRAEGSGLLEQQTRDSARIAVLPTAPPRGPSAWWATAAVLVGLAGGGAWLVEQQLATSGDQDARAALQVDAERIATVLDTEARAVHGRVDGLASAPMLRAAVETDAATVADMVADGQLIRPRGGEIIELVQAGAAHLRLLRLPALAGRAAASIINPSGTPGTNPGGTTPGAPTTQLSVEAGQLVLTATSPVVTQAGAIGGTLAIATPLERGLLERLVARDAVTASLVGLDHPLVLAGSSSSTGTALVVVPIVLDHDLGLATLQLSARVRPAARGQLWGAAQLASLGLASLLLAIYALGWLSYRVRR
jgi:tRNA A-37 threonylcarbamoyl transferase component Bud32